MDELTIYMVFEVVLIILLILLLIARCKVVKKINGKGWQGLLPIYGYGLICKKSNISIFLLVLYYAIFAYAFLLFIVIFVSAFVEFESILLIIFFGSNLDKIENTMIFSEKVINKAEKELIYFFIVAYLMRVYFAYKHAISFGKTKKSAIIYAIFNPFEMFFLGFSNAKYKIVKKKTK